MTESASDRYERLAAAFHAETGLMAPGKDVPAAMGGGRAGHEERTNAWLKWTHERAVRMEQDAAIVAHIAQHAVLVQVELRTPHGVRCVSWAREDGVPVREWLAREVGRIGAPEVVRVAAPVGAGEVGDAA